MPFPIPFAGFFVKLLVGVYVVHKFIVLYFGNGPPAPSSSSRMTQTPSPITCYGCKHNKTDPEFHTDYGGCLYSGIEI